MAQIPRVIHYCWFGGNPLPDEAVKCIDSWRRFCPDYQIQQWDESNYNLDACAYIREAYREKKWAFVSDYARFDILYNHGGIYLDTDVELIRPIDDILNQGPYMGIERGEGSLVAPGLGMAMFSGHPVCAAVLEEYRSCHFLNPDGSYNQVTVVGYTTAVLKQYGLKTENTRQCVAGIWIYPWDYFCPMEFKTGRLDITGNTRSIHHYSASWLAPEEQAALRFTFLASKRFGPKAGYLLGRIHSFPYRVKMKVKKLGFWGALQFSAEKVFEWFVK